MNRLEREFSAVELGKLISRVIEIPGKIQDFLTSFFLFFFPRALTVIIISVYFYFLDWKVASLFIGLFVVYLTSLLYSGVTKCSLLASNFHQLSESQYSSLEDKFSNATSIFTFGQKRREVQLAKEVNKKVSDVHTQVLECSSWGRNLTNVFLAIVFTSVCSLSIYLFFCKEISHEVMMTIILTMSFMIPNLEAFATLSDIGYFMGQFKEINAFLSELEEPLQEPVVVSYPATKDTLHSDHLFPKILIRQLSFSYSSSSPSILKNVNLTIMKHELIVIKGNSGSGKTTFLKLLTGFLKPQEGLIQILGKNIKEYGVQELRAMIGMVSQSTRLFNTTVLQNMIYGSEWMSKGEKETEEFVSNFLKILEVSDMFVKMPHGLLSLVGIGGEDVSGGQRQVILIVRLLLNSMDSTSTMQIAILDEPTSAVDSTHTKVIVQLLKKLSKKLTTIVVTHDSLVSSLLQAREINLGA
jgi:ABC-type multidrug transport system fused ATPase/permease subunit